MERFKANRSYAPSAIRQNWQRRDGLLSVEMSRFGASHGYDWGRG